MLEAFLAEPLAAAHRPIVNALVMSGFVWFVIKGMRILTVVRILATGGSTVLLHLQCISRYKLLQQHMTGSLCAILLQYFYNLSLRKFHGLLGSAALAEGVTVWKFPGYDTGTF